jgi:serine/threonine protein kinase
MAQVTPKVLAGRYNILAEIQAGGMTTVYRARDLQTDSLVAVKYFDRDRHLPAIQQEAYLREVEALRNLSHPNIVKLLDAGEDGDKKSFLVLELMKHDLIAEKNADGVAFEGWDDFADLVVSPLLSALAHAHEMGIAHRDIKPANILVSSDGVVKLADFGISKLKSWLLPRVTLCDFISPPFSPPEPDTGDFTYARDVFSVGALCVWALSDRPVTSVSELEQALKTLNVPPVMLPILRQTMASSPSDRHQSAALLGAEISRIQNMRRKEWVLQQRKRCPIGLTKMAMEDAREELALDSEDRIQAFVQHDINTDSAIQRFRENVGTMNERIVAGHYSVLGETFRYHIAHNDKGHKNFSLIRLTRADPHFQQRDRQNSALCPLTFDLRTQMGQVSFDDAAQLIERSLEEFERQRREEERQSRQTAVFDGWLRVLDAQIQYEREKSLPIEFTSSQVDGTLLLLETDSDLDGVEIGEARFVENKDGYRIRGEVWETRAGTLVLNCPGANLDDVPKRGIAKLDLYALNVAVERQREAINRIRNATTVTSRLRDVILNPETAAIPTPLDTLAPGVRDMLDQSKQDAVRSACGSPEVFLVQGPPGTGKTHFIAGLVIEFLSRNPTGRILLTSQTHVAIDNALERLGDNLPGSRILRIAREQGSRVAAAAEPFLISSQMRAWRTTVQAAAKEGLSKWATRNGIDANDMFVGTLARQLAEVRIRIERNGERIKADENRAKSLESRDQRDALMVPELELDQLKADLQELRDQWDSDKKLAVQIEDDLRKSRADAKSLIELTPDELSEWADVLIGNQQAERLTRLQSEWLNRFGISAAFIGPLIETSSIVASTCVGLAALDAIDEVEFDLCIIDEASKATAMECCVPMVRAKRWLLVGDSKQLPPFREEVLASPELRERFEIESPEASESMFERLVRMLPTANKVMLTTQYRMVEPIGRLISECFYDGALINKKTAVDAVICSCTGFAVNWMTTRLLATRAEESAGTSFVNPEEASQICTLLLQVDAALRTAKRTTVRNVLVLSGYTAQVNHLERRMRNIRHQLTHLTVECCTVDRVQGRQAHIAFFSVTRSNASGRAGHLRALERINVALSRAMEMLVIVGDDEFVRRAHDMQPLQLVLNHIQRNGAECCLRVLEKPRSVGRS